jgi:hypothetical protein
VHIADQTVVFNPFVSHLLQVAEAGLTASLYWTASPRSTIKALTITLNVTVV